MALGLLILIPFLGALICQLLPHGNFSRRWRPNVVAATGVVNLAFAFVCVIFHEGEGFFNGWLVLDPVGSVFLLSMSCLHACCALYAPSYLHRRVNVHNRVFCICLNLLLGMSTLVFLSHHLGL